MQVETRTSLWTRTDECVRGIHQLDHLCVELNRAETTDQVEILTGRRHVRAKPSVARDETCAIVLISIFIS